MNTEELIVILAQHKKWLNDDGGKRASLTGADLSGAYLREANLRGADLSGAYLSEANLRGADLSGADLSGAKYKGITIGKISVLTGLYKYTVLAIIAEDGTQHIALGCKFQSRDEWQTNFWNNTSEFPDDDSEATALRKFALVTACRRLDIMAGGEA